MTYAGLRRREYRRKPPQNGAFRGAIAEAEGRAGHGWKRLAGSFLPPEVGNDGSLREVRACLKKHTRSAPVLGRREVGRGHDLGNRAGGRRSDVAAPGYGRTPPRLGPRKKTNSQTGSQPERCSRKSRTEVCRAGRTALPACPRVHQREHQRVWPNERSFSSAHRLAGRDRQDACPTFYCIVPAQQPAQWRATRVKVPPVELDGSRPTAPCLSRREAGRGKQLGY